MKKFEAIYEGQYQDGLASGYGRYITKDAMYTGYFGNGNLNG